MNNEWNNLNKGEITEACLNINIENDKFISDLSNIEKTGKIVVTNKKYTTYELNHNGNIYHIKISIDNENKKRLEKINNIPFYMLKYERALKQWAFIPEKDMNNKMGKITFHEREFNEVRDIVKYLAYIFYIKAGIGNISAEVDNFKQISDLINHFIISIDNKYFKCIDKNKYIIMDLILTHKSKRVFCIFEENSISNQQPYKLIQICTESNILYNTDNKNGNILLNVKKSKYPDRNVQIVEDNTLISFKDAKISFKDKDDQKYSFYKHITDDNHWERLKNTYEEKFKNLDENKGLSEDEIKKKFIKLLKNKILETFNVNKERQVRIVPDNTSIYIRNLESKFLPTVRPCVFLEINLLGDLYYLVLSCSQSELSKRYSFIAETLYTKEMYENRFKME